MAFVANVEAHVDVSAWREASGVGIEPVTFPAYEADVVSIAALLRRVLEACSKRADAGLPAPANAELVDLSNMKPLSTEQIARWREQQGRDHPAVVLRRKGKPENLNFKYSQQLQSSAAYITSMTSGKDVAPVHLFTEFVDNSLKALKDAPSDRPKVIDTYVLQERLEDGRDFTAIIVRDSGVGMDSNDMTRWTKRGSMPERSHREEEHDDVEDLMTAELQRTFLLDPDLSTFGRGASEAGFALGRNVAFVSKRAESQKVWELVGEDKADNRYWDHVDIVCRDRLEQTAEDIESGAWAKPWQDTHITSLIPGARDSKQLPRLMHYMESFGTSEGAEGNSPPESFTYVIIANLKEESPEEVPRVEIFKNFNRDANHIKSLYFYFLGYGPYHGRFFGGSLPFDPAAGPPHSLDEALDRTQLPKGSGMTPPLALDETGKAMRVRMHVFFKCEPSGSADARPGRDAGLESDCLAEAALRPELAKCLLETGGTPRPSSWRHRCLNDLPYEMWPARGPQSAVEAAREDAMSRRLRNTLQRPMTLAIQAASALSADEASTAVAQLSALHGFAFAARNTGWASGNLPIVFALQYVPQECGRPTISELTGAGMSELQEAARTGRSSEWADALRYCTRPLLSEAHDRLTFHWNGRLVGDRCVPALTSTPLLPFMQLDQDGKVTCTEILAKYFPEQVRELISDFDENQARKTADIKQLKQRLNKELLERSNNCITGSTFVADLKVHEHATVTKGKFSRADGKDGARSAQTSHVKHKGMDKLAKEHIKDASHFLAYYSKPGRRYDDLFFAKGFVPCNGRKGGYGDPAFSKLSPPQCLSLDFCLWLATCSAELDVKLELREPWPNLKLVTSLRASARTANDVVVYKECSDGRTTFARGDFFCADLAALNKRQTVAGSRKALKQYVVIEGFIVDDAPPHRPLVVGRRVFRSEDCVHKTARSLKEFHNLKEPLVVLDAVYGKLIKRLQSGGAPPEVTKYLKETYSSAIPRGIVCCLERHLTPSEDREGNVMAVPGFPSAKAVWSSRHVENFCIALLPHYDKDKEVQCCHSFVAPVAAEGTATQVARSAAVGPAATRGAAGGGGSSAGAERPSSSTQEVTVAAVKLSNPHVVTDANNFFVSVQLQKQSGSGWEAVKSDVATSVNLVATPYKNPLPKSFSPSHTKDSQLFKVTMPRDLPQLEPGRYRFAITVTHTLLTGSAQQSATRQQAPMQDDDALAASYLPIEFVKVCEYQTAAMAKEHKLKLADLPHPHATDASTAVPFMVQPGEPVSIVCTGLVHADEPVVLGMTAEPGFANSQASPRLQLVLQATDASGMHCSGASALKFVRDNVAACEFSLEWQRAPGTAVSAEVPMPFVLHVPPLPADLRAQGNAVHVPAFVFCTGGDALELAKNALPWIKTDAPNASRPLSLRLAVTTPGEAGRGPQRVPLKLLPGFPAACFVSSCPKQITNEAGSLKKENRIVVRLLDGYGLPASVASDDDPGGWPVRRPALSLSALGHDLVGVAHEALEPTEAWDVSQPRAELTLRLPLRRVPLSAEEWAQHENALPCKLHIDLLEGAFPPNRNPVWTPVSAPMVMQDGTPQPQGMQHLLPEAPPVLVPSERPATVHVSLADKTNAELLATAHDGALQRWTLRAPASKLVSGVAIEVRTETGAVIDPRNPHLSLISKTPRVSAGCKGAKRNVQSQEVSGLKAPTSAGAPPAEAAFEVHYAKQDIAGLSFLLQVIAQPHPAARWAVEAELVGDGVAPATVALRVSRLDSGGQLATDPLTDPATELPDVEVTAEDGRRLEVAWLRAPLTDTATVLPDRLQDTSALLQLRGCDDITVDNAHYCPPGLLVATEVPNGVGTKISFVARSAPHSSQQLEPSAAFEVVVRPGLLHSVRPEMAPLPNVCYHALPFPAVSLVFLDRWESPTSKLTEDGSLPEYRVDVLVKGKAPPIETERNLPAPLLEAGACQVGTRADHVRLADGSQQMDGKVVVRLRVTVGRRKLTIRIGETVAAKVLVLKALRLGCIGQGCAMIAQDKAACLASDRGIVDITALPVIGDEVLPSLVDDEELCKRMRDAFPRRLPDGTVTVQHKNQPVEMPEPTATVPRQHVKLSLKLPINKPLEYAINVAYREPNPEIAACLEPLDREALGKVKLTVVNAAAHRMAVEVVAQRGVFALDNGGASSIKIKLSAQDAFGNELYGKCPIDLPEEVRAAGAAYELSELLPIEVLLLPVAAPDAPIRLVGEPSKANINQRASLLPVTLRVAEPGSEGLGVAGPCRMIVKTRQGALPEGAGTVEVEERVQWTDVHTLAEEEARRRREALAEQQRLQQEQLQQAILQTGERVAAATAQCQRIEEAKSNVASPLWQSFLSRLITDEARDLRERITGNMPPANILQLYPSELGEMCESKNGKGLVELIGQLRASAQSHSVAELSNQVRQGAAAIRANMDPQIRHFGVTAELVEIDPQAVGHLQTGEQRLRNLVAKFFKDALNQALLWDRAEMARYNDVLHVSRIGGQKPQPTKANAVSEYVRGNRQARHVNAPRGFVSAQQVLKASPTLRQRAEEARLTPADAAALCDLVPRLVAGGTIFHPGTQQEAGQAMGRHTAPCICVADGTMIAASGVVDFDDSRCLAPNMTLPEGKFNLPAVASTGLSAAQLQHLSHHLLLFLGVYRWFESMVHGIKERIEFAQQRAASLEPQPEAVPDYAQVADVVERLSTDVQQELQQRHHEPNIVELIHITMQPLLAASADAPRQGGGPAGYAAGEPARANTRGAGRVPMQQHAAAMAQNGAGGNGAQHTHVLAPGRGAGRGRPGPIPVRGRGGYHGGRGAARPQADATPAPMAAVGKRGAPPDDGAGGKRARRG